MHRSESSCFTLFRPRPQGQRTQVYSSALAGAACALLLGASAVGQEVRPSHRLDLKYESFDPLVKQPTVPAAIRADASVHLYLVQFQALPTERDRAAVRSLGASIHTYMPENAYIVRMGAREAADVARLPSVRATTIYEPAYRLEPAVVAEIATDSAIPTRRYNLLVVDKRTDKATLAVRIGQIGGEVVNMHDGSMLMEARLDRAQLMQVVQMDEILFVDRWQPVTYCMDNARAQGGANYVESVASYTGMGVKGHIYEGVEFDHYDFNTPLTAVHTVNLAESHGHCTAGIVFGNGSSTPEARGLAPDGIGFFTIVDTVGVSRYVTLGDLVTVHGCTFTTASWTHGFSTTYTNLDAYADEIIFDHRIPWTQAHGNSGDNNAGVYSWAKNVLSVGGVRHGNNSDPSDDTWSFGASIGPASDGRIKPDLCAYFDSIWTSDRTGAAGYAPGDHNQTFGGTSGATPIVAGFGALAIEMYTDGIFGNALPLPATVANRSANRPLAQTHKALLIASARQYAFNSTSTDLLREHQGWGFPNVQRLYDQRDRTLIVPEDLPLTQGSVASYGINVPANQDQLRVCMTFVDPPGNPAAAQSAINNMDLRVTSPSGAIYWGNQGLRTGNWSTTGGSADAVDTVECVFVENPEIGTWRVEVRASAIVQDAHRATPAVDATFALVVQGGGAGSLVAKSTYGSGCSGATEGAYELFGPTSIVAPDICGTGTAITFFAHGFRLSGHRHRVGDLCGPNSRRGGVERRRRLRHGPAVIADAGAGRSYESAAGCHQRLHSPDRDRSVRFVGFLADGRRVRGVSVADDLWTVVRLEPESGRPNRLRRECRCRLRDVGCRAAI